MLFGLALNFLPHFFLLVPKAQWQIQHDFYTQKNLIFEVLYDP